MENHYKTYGVQFLILLYKKIMKELLFLLKKVDST